MNDPDQLPARALLHRGGAAFQRRTGGRGAGDLAAGGVEDPARARGAARDGALRARRAAAAADHGRPALPEARRPVAGRARPRRARARRPGGGRRAGGRGAADGGDAGAAEGGARLRARGAGGVPARLAPVRTGSSSRSSATAASTSWSGGSPPRTRWPGSSSSSSTPRRWWRWCAPGIRCWPAPGAEPRRLAADPAAAGRDHPAGGGAAFPLPPASRCRGRRSRRCRWPWGAAWCRPRTRSGSSRAGVVAEELAAGTLVALGLGGMAPAGPVGLTLRSGQEPSDALRQLMQALRDACQEGQRFTGIP